MIPARHTLMGRLVSELYSGPKLKAAFHSVRFMGGVEDTGLPVLLLANHFSWWDGFIQYRLNKRFFRRKLYVMMLEEQLRQHMILNRCGCFSVNKRTRDMIRSLDYSADVLHGRDNMLLIFPQGEIQSMHRSYIPFQSGLRYLLNRIETPYSIVMNVNLVDYASEKKPRLTVYFDTYDSSGGKPAFDLLEKGYNEFYTACKAHQIASI